MLSRTTLPGSKGATLRWILIPVSVITMVYLLFTCGSNSSSDIIPRADAGSLAEFTVRVMHDSPPPNGRQSTYLYMFTLPANQESSEWETLAQLLLREYKGVESVDLLMVGGPPASGYTGFVVSCGSMMSTIRRVKEVGMPKVRCLPVPQLISGHINTLTEAQALVAYCAENAITAVSVMSVGFHLPRAMASALTSATKANPSDPLRVYAVPASRDKWSEVVVHSQGKLRGPRSEMLKSEIDRIFRYTAKGDLFPSGRLLQLMDERDPA